jgi:glycosyltransferase involved in cell wall biosynthesis
MGTPSAAVCRRLAGRDDVRLLGRLPPADLLAHLANVDIALYPRTVGGGVRRMKIAEYMAMGVPTVAYEHEETRVLDDTGTGTLVRSPRQFVDAVATLARDPARRQAMSAAGLALAPGFEAAGLARRYEEILDLHLACDP